MSQRKNRESKVEAKLSSQISVSDESADTSTQLSSAKCRSGASTQKRSVSSKLFSWNREKPRKTSEYVKKKFGEPPFNRVAPELRVIGGLGAIKCVAKQEQQPLINRPTQVQKLCHTRNNLLPNFPLTERLRPAACLKKKTPSVSEAVERIKLAENLPSPSKSSSSDHTDGTKETFNHQNPFKLDLQALSDYQKQKHNAEENQRRRNYQIIRRTMETKALKTEGVEEIKQELRNEKFRLPAFFKVVETSKAEEGGGREEADNLPPKSCNESSCLVVLTADKPKNREILQRHFEHKREKLRVQIQEKAVQSDELAKETQKLQAEEGENLVFRLADESFPPSECDSNERAAMQEPSPAYEKLDYPVNESELYELKRKLKSLKVVKSEKLLAVSANNASDMELSIACGEKVGSRVALRSFRDRISAEPRGEINFHQRQATEQATCLTHKQWLDAMANDPKILKEPPRGRILSTVKVERQPNDDKMLLFDDSPLRKENVAIVSPIRQHIRKIDEKLKTRLCQSNAKKSKSHTSIVANNNNHNAKRYSRMKFMGIPVPQAPHPPIKISQVELKSFVGKFSSILSHTKLPSDAVDESIDDVERKQAKVRISPEVVKLIPKIPEFDYTKNDKRELSKAGKFVPFSKAQPRGTNPKNLRVDKSLPWIQDELVATKATKAKLEAGCEDGKSFAGGSRYTDLESHVQSERKTDEDSSAMKRSYHEIIAEKLQENQAPDENINEQKECDNGVSDVKIQSTAASGSSLSSEGTYFTNDSGSYLMELGEKIPKSHLNLHKKFQNRSLVTTKPLGETNPFFIPSVDQYYMIREWKKTKDKFHTFRSRSCANIRERVHIESPAYEDELIGGEKSKLATDVDEYYRSELYHERSRTCYRFKPITEMIKLRDTLRVKMDVYWMKEKMVLDHVDMMKQEAILEQTNAQILEYDQFLTAHKEKSYRESIKVMQSVKIYYKESDTLRKKLEDLRNSLEQLKMKIFYSGDDYSKKSVLQKVQYLLKPSEWRQNFDHIHRTSEGVLKGYKESIANRETANIWDRNNVTVYTIKNFIEDVYVKTNQQPLRVFECGEAVEHAVQELRSKAYRSLLQFHHLSHGLADTNKQFILLEEKNNSTVEHLERLTQSLSKRRVFMEARSVEIQKAARKVIDKPLEESVAAEELRTLKALSGKAYQDIIVKNGDPSLIKFYMSVDKIAAVEKKVLTLLATLDRVPQDLIMKFGDEIRNERKRKLRVAERAHKIELSVQLRIEQLQRSLAKPPEKEKREGKLPMSLLPKKPPKIKVEKPLLTAIEEDYVRAFTELGSDGEIKFDENAKLMLDRIKNESIPFYLDHLFEKLGHKITTSTDRDDEEILNDEAANFKFKDVLPKARSQVKVWQQQSEKAKKENIRKTPYLYE